MSVSRAVWVVILGSLLVVGAFAITASGLVSAFTPASHSSHPSVPGPGSGSPSQGYNVTFQQTGLPANTTWSVTIVHLGARANGTGGSWSRGVQNSSNGTIGFVLPNGTYFFSVLGVEAAGTLYTPTPAHGNFTVNGTGMTEQVTFSPLPTYPLVFSESGLPSGTFWSVRLGGIYPYSGGESLGGASPACNRSTWNGSTSSTVNFTVPNGSYAFSISNAYSGGLTYLAAPSSGNVTVNGSGATVTVTFTAETNYTVTFAETGLPTGTFWSVALSGSAWGGGWGGTSPRPTPLCPPYGWKGSTNSTIEFAVQNGTYFFVVGPVGGNGTGPIFVPSPSFGNVSVNGTDVTVPIAFTPIVLYNVTFSETGLPGGTNWSVALFNDSVGWQFNGSTNASVSFYVPNGSYNFSISNASNNSTSSSRVYVPTPANGSVLVSGSNVVVDVTFAPVTLYNVTFVESGLPGGTNWSVTLFNDSVGWLFNGSTNASVSFYVPNGSYNFSVGNTSNCTAMFVPFPAGGTITVDGAGFSVPITFTVVQLDNLTFHETGLPNGSGWFVVLFAPGGGWLFNSSNSSNVSFLVPNGTYGFEVGISWGAGGYYSPTPIVGWVNVTASNVTVEVTYTFTAASGGGSPMTSAPIADTSARPA